MVAEDGIFQNDFLQKLDELVGQVGSHEGTDRGGDVVSILGLTERCLYNLNVNYVTNNSVQSTIPVI